MLHKITTYYLIAIIAMLVSTRPLLHTMSKFKTVYVSSLMDSENEEESKSKNLEEEGDTIYYSDASSFGNDLSLFSPDTLKVADRYALKKISPPFIKGFHIPPEA